MKIYFENVYCWINYFKYILDRIRVYAKLRTTTNLRLKMQIPMRDYISRDRDSDRELAIFATGKPMIFVTFPGCDGTAEEAALSRNWFAKRMSTKWTDSSERSPPCEMWNLRWSSRGREGGRERWCDERSICCAVNVCVCECMYIYIYIYSSLRPMAGSLRNDYVRDIEARFETSFK